MYQPKDIVSGDFYWLKTQKAADSNDVYVYFAVADCTGHGVPGALVSIVCNNALNKALLEASNPTPADLLNRTRELLAQEFEKYNEEVQDGMDISLIRFKRNAENNLDSAIDWAGANNQLLIVRNQECIEIKADKQPVGAHLFEKEFTNHHLMLQKEDRIYLFSDGYQDQFGGATNKKYKYSNLKKQLLNQYQLSLEEQHRQLLTQFVAWKGDQEQIDDVTIACICF